MNRLHQLNHNIPGLGALIIGISLASLATPARAVDYIWWEGEKPKESNFPPSSSFVPANDAEKAHLSGGAWLTAEGGRLGQPALWVKYEVQVPKAGRYQFWTRKFWKHGPFKWRFDEQPWAECPPDCPLVNIEDIRKFLSVCWVFLGDVELKEGPHVLHIEGTEFQLEKPKEPEAPPPPAEYRTVQATDWCKLTLPKEVKAGQTIEVTVESQDLPGRYHVLCGMGHRSGNDEFLGFIEDAKPSPEFEGPSKHTFQFKVPYQNLQCVKFGISYLPEGKTKPEDQLQDKRVNSPLVGVDQNSFQPPRNVGPMCFDCFLLTTDLFAPRGKMKPDEKIERTPIEGWTFFDPKPDFGGEALLDLRALNQKEAGADGWVKRKGRELVFEKTGQPVRFWGVCAGPEDWNQSKNTVDYLARKLAKRGVNLVRMHFGEWSYDQPGPELDQAQYFMTAMKKQGIYVEINIFCTACFKAKPRWKIPEFLPGYVPYSELFYYKPLQDRYKEWAQCLLATPNPYAGGVPMGKDPAVACLEIIDESNLFWGTFNPYYNPQEVTIHVLEKRFGDWLIKKYGSLDKLKEVWKKKLDQGGEEFVAVKGDDWARGLVGLAPTGIVGYAARCGHPIQRYKDQVEFMTEVQKQAFAELTEWFHKSLGFGGLVCPTNWVVTENTVLDPLDKYTYTVGDVVARNNYVSGRHLGERAGFAISQGDRYQDLATVLEPEKAAPLLTVQQADYPFFWTEGSWNAPNRYRTEMPALVAAYAALQGINGIMLFATEADWNPAPVKNWPIQTPGVLGQFPAAALMYRLGYVKAAPEAIREALQLKDLYDFKGSMTQNSMGLDSYRAHEAPQDGGSGPQQIKGYDLLTPLVGPVVREVGENPKPSAVLADVSKFIDRPGKTVTSATGELKLDWGKGLLTINTPCAQGAVGFLAKVGPVQLPAVTIESRNEFGAILVVSMDGNPLASSAKILLQVMSEEEVYGRKTSPIKEKMKVDGKEVQVDMLKIDDMGGPPLLLRNFAGIVTIKRSEAGALKVRALDANGRIEKELPGGSGESLKVELLPGCLYYLIQK